MEITIKYTTLTNVIWELKEDIKSSSEMLEKLLFTIDTIYGISLNNTAVVKIENFFRVYQRRIRECNNAKLKFLKKHEEWLKSELSIKIEKNISGRPIKDYDDVKDRTKKKKQEDIINAHSATLLKNTFKTVLLKTQPKNAGQIVDVLPTASPKRLRRMVQSIPTPKSTTEFSEEDSLALVLNLGLSRNKYEIIRKALIDKQWGYLPSTKLLQATKAKILPSEMYVDDTAAKIRLSDLLQNTASRIISEFSEEQMELCNNSEITLICKWGCDGSSGFSEYKQQSGSSTDYSTIFMASLVPLRMRLYNESSSSSSTNSFQDMWINSTPGSKFLCRPIRFEYVKEDRNTTQTLVDDIRKEIADLVPIFVEICGRITKVSFQLHLTMIDGKVANAITETRSYWKCNICGKKLQNLMTFLLKSNAMKMPLN